MCALMDGESLDVNEQISDNDPMYRYNPDLYWVAGRKALRRISLAR